MQESVNRYADGVRRKQGVPIQISVGLNSGEVVVGAIGNDLKMDYTAIGETVHLAARMEQIATPGSIMIAPDTLRLAEGFVRLKPLGPVNVKGISEPLEVHEVKARVRCVRGCKPQPRADLPALSGEPLNSYAMPSAGASQSHPWPGGSPCRRTRRRQVTAVLGVHDSPRTVDWLILESGSVSYGKATAYLPVTDLLKAYFASRTEMMCERSARRSQASS